jgi:outer membrane protein assembly factor BamB
MAASPNGADVFITGITQPPKSRPRYATVGYNALTGARLWSSIFHQGPKRNGSYGDHVVVSPDSSTVYVTGGTADGISTVAYDAATGAKRWVADSSAGAGGTGLAVSPDGKTLFVAAYGFTGTGAFDYVTLAYSAASGTLLWTAPYSGSFVGSGNTTPQVAVSPDGSAVFLRGQASNSYLTIAYNPTTGERLWAHLFSGLGEAYSESMVVSPDSSRVFIVGNSKSTTSPLFSYATVAYDAKTGARQWVQYDPGLSSQIGRTGATSIAIKPDGTAVFVTGENTEANGTGGYSTIAYDAATGAKLWQQRYFASGSGGEAAEAWFAGVSPDGSEVFVTGLTHVGHFATLAYNSTSGAELWSAVARHAFCGDAVAAVNPTTPDVMVSGTCRNRDTPPGVQNYLTVAYRG